MRSCRYLHVQGAPGSGKSAVLLEAALRSVRSGLTVLVVCPTRALVTTLQLQLPEVEGVDRIHVDTIHSVLKYKRSTEEAVSWTPPSAFRKYDLILCDEGSQYDNREWKRLFTCMKDRSELQS